MAFHSGRTVLVVAYHFPPFTGSSGVQRTVKFCRYLLENDWQPVVLTVTPSAYQQTCQQYDTALPENIPVYRSFCLDTARHLSLQGKYPELLALPDRWVSWWPSGVIKGRQIIKKYKPDAIWSTYPVATAHLIAGALSRLYSLPWVADFRDWMTEDDYPASQLQRWAYRNVERFVLENATSATFTTDSSRNLYMKRYPHFASDQWEVLPNGYDESDFANLAAPIRQRPDSDIRLLHSGFLYPEDRNPTGLFKAMGCLRRQGFFEEHKVRVQFRGSGDPNFVMRKAAKFGVADLVEVLPLVSQQLAIKEMLSSSALMLMQGARFNRQIPAKAYEYLRSQKPVLTLAPPHSESAKLMQSLGLPYSADPDSYNDIAVCLQRLVLDIKAKRETKATPSQIRKFDRRLQTSSLARILDNAVNTGTTALAQT